MASFNAATGLGIKFFSFSKICSHTWKWFDISNGKWCPYAATSNKQIDDAFWAGEQNVKIQNGRRKYSIQFGTMMQVNTRVSRGVNTSIDTIAIGL